MLRCGFSECGSLDGKTHFNAEGLTPVQRGSDTSSRFIKETVRCTMAGRDRWRRELFFPRDNFSTGENHNHALTYLEPSPGRKAALCLEDGLILQTKDTGDDFHPPCSSPPPRVCVYVCVVSCCQSCSSRGQRWVLECLCSQLPLTPKLHLTRLEDTNGKMNLLAEVHSEYV